MMNISKISSYATEDGFFFGGAYLFEQGKCAALLSREQGTTLFVSSALAADIAEGKIGEGCRLKLVQHGMGRYRQSPVPCMESEGICPVFFMIDLTKSCSLACRYCFRDLEDKTLISDERLSDICAFILSHAEQNKLRRVNIQAWGGEPALAFEKVKSIYRFFEGSGVEVKLCMETNATVITDALAAEARAMKMQIGISLDGFPALHNLQRPFVNGMDSYNRVIEGMRCFHRHGYEKNHQGICVVTRRSLGCAKRIVEHFCDDLGLNLFKFGFIKANPQMRMRELDLTPEEAAAFALEMLDAVVAKCRSGYAVVESNIRVRLLNLLTRGTSDICFSRGCMGGRKLVTFDQEGNIFSCELMDIRHEAFGSIYSGKDLNTMVREAMESHPFFRKKSCERCSDCPWHFYCRGACTSAVRYKEGSYTGGVDEIGCAVNRVLYPRLMELLLTEPAVVKVLSGQFAELEVS